MVTCLCCRDIAASEKMGHHSCGQWMLYSNLELSYELGYSKICFPKEFRWMMFQLAAVRDQDPPPTLPVADTWDQPTCQR
jgi:hypothetical protein